MKRKLVLMLMIVLTGLTINVSAQARRGLQPENKVIRHNARSGQLTRHETIRLKKEENRLRKEAIRFKTNDGQIGPVEKRKLRHDRRKLDRDIRRQSHDAQQH